MFHSLIPRAWLLQWTNKFPMEQARFLQPFSSMEEDGSPVTNWNTSPTSSSRSQTRDSLGSALITVWLRKISFRQRRTTLNERSNTSDTTRTDTKWIIDALPL